MHILYIQNLKNARHSYIKNPETLQKARQFALRFIYKNPHTLRYAIFMNFFEIDIYIQKA